MITPPPKHMTPEAVREVQAAIKLANTRHEANRVWAIIAKRRNHTIGAIRKVERAMAGHSQVELEKEQVELIIAIYYMLWDLDDEEIESAEKDIISFDAARVAKVIAMFGEGQEKIE